MESVIGFMVERFKSRLELAIKGYQDITERIKQIDSKKIANSKQIREIECKIEELNCELKNNYNDKKPNLLNQIFNTESYRQYVELMEKLGSLEDQLGELKEENERLTDEKKQLQEQLPEAKKKAEEATELMNISEREILEREFIENPNRLINHSGMAEIVYKYPDLIKYYVGPSEDVYLSLFNKLKVDIEDDETKSTSERATLLNDVETIISKINRYSSKELTPRIPIKYLYEAIRSKVAQKSDNSKKCQDIILEVVKKYLVLDFSIDISFEREMEKLYEDPSTCMALYYVVQDNQGGFYQTKEEIFKQGIRINSSKNGISNGEPPKANSIFKIAHYSNVCFLDMFDTEGAKSDGYYVLQIPNDGIKPGGNLKIWGTNDNPENTENVEYYLLPNNIAGYVSKSNKRHSLGMEKRKKIYEKTPFQYHLFDSNARHGKLAYVEMHKKREEESEK